MSQESTTPFKINLPVTLKDRLSAAAERSGRSLTSEIITRLQASLSLGDELGLEFTRDSIEELIINIVQAETNPITDRLHDIEQHLMAIDRLGR